ncbi:hypothetical protein LTR37_020569 [Vermiconidia calcicola]|uniref:Uncharacterized protein n=1 Tax=Vermiconidia calcicola TaxID=1690605 RepID=A0ACC3MAV4_9PEZI|nr:hypothetical protein LTR37_020569 [Vermiconidia calcicola]
MDLTNQPPTISVTLHDLQADTVSLETLEQAFGPASLGVIIVTDLPPEYVALRQRVLSLASYLAALPDRELGWSLGKETLASGRYDTLKGSFYAQPIYNTQLEARARRLYPQVPEFTSPNLWPSEDVLPGFRESLEGLCTLVVDVAGEVAKNCDRYGVEKLDGYEKGMLEGIVRGSVATKARLLHYYPPPPPSSSSSSLPAEPEEQRPDSAVGIDDGWCTTHKDLGALTGLTSQMYIDESLHTPQSTSSGDVPNLPELDAHPDPQAGLWIKNRSGSKTQVHIPRDALAFQTGEALEVITRGAFHAVPHFVRGPAAGAGSSSIARNTLAVFTQPNLWEMVDDERDFAAFGQFSLGKTV